MTRSCNNFATSSLSPSLADARGTHAPDRTFPESCHQNRPPACPDVPWPVSGLTEYCCGGCASIQIVSPQSTPRAAGRQSHAKQRARASTLGANQQDSKAPQTDPDRRRDRKRDRRRDRKIDTPSSSPCLAKRSVEKPPTPSCQQCPYQCQRAS